VYPRITKSKHDNIIAGIQDDDARAFRASEYSRNLITLLYRCPHGM